MNSTLSIFQEHGETSSSENRDIEINPVVCVTNKCQMLRVCSSLKAVPAVCPFEILHLFNIKENPIKPRRWGKTHYLVDMAKELSDAGLKVYYVTFNMATAEGIRGQNRLVDNRLIEFTTIQKIKHGDLSSKEDGYLLCDEITEDEVKWLEDHIRNTGFRILAHLWTPRP